MKNRSLKNRPQWAACLPEWLWKKLHECQGKRPTLRQLNADIAFQEENGIVCRDCSLAVRLINTPGGTK